MDSQSNKEFFEKVNPGCEITREEYISAVVSAHKARSAVSYLIWKKLKEMYPEADADAVLINAYREYGVRAGEKWGDIQNAKQSLLAQSSRSGYLAFRQELKEYSEDYAEKDFYYCPHVEALRELGASSEEVRFFCQEVLSAGDYGNLEPHPCVKLEFKKQIGAGDDHCEYCVTRIQQT